jgi:NADPH2:quinone reductase
MAEFAAIPAQNAVRVPKAGRLEQAALFRSNAETSAFALRKAVLAPGETLLVLGAGGGTGYSAVQLGKLAGARVLASASSPEKRAIALEAGADAAVDSGAADWREQVAAFAGPDGVDVVYDPLGGAQTERAFRTLGWNGRHLMVGFAAGEIPSLPCNLPLLKGASLVGANLLQAQKFEPQACAREAERLMALFGEGRLGAPPIGRRYSLDQVAEAYAAVASGTVAGRVVVRVGEGSA